MNSTPHSGAKADFDEEAARQESYRLDETEHCHDIDFFIDNYSFIEGARWQHSRDAAVIEKLQRELEKNETDYIEMVDYADQLRKQLSAKDAEIEKLKKEIYFLRQYGNKDCTAMADKARQALGEKGDG
jgi:hypothetical protein